MLGIILSGVILAVQYQITHNLFEGWRTDSQSFSNDNIDWNTLNENDHARSVPRRGLDVVGYFSFGSFILGSFLALHALLAMNETDVSLHTEISTPSIERNDIPLKDVSIKKADTKEKKSNALKDTRK